LATRDDSAIERAIDLLKTPPIEADREKATVIWRLAEMRKECNGKRPGGDAISGRGTLLAREPQRLGHVAIGGYRLDVAIRQLCSSCTRCRRRLRLRTCRALRRRSSSSRSGPPMMARPQRRWLPAKASTSDSLPSPLSTAADTIRLESRMSGRCSRVFVASLIRSMIAAMRVPPRCFPWPLRLAQRV
jgi:hypothetical protein